MLRSQSFFGRLLTFEISPAPTLFNIIQLFNSNNLISDFKKSKSFNSNPAPGKKVRLRSAPQHCSFIYQEYDGCRADFFLRWIFGGQQSSRCPCGHADTLALLGNQRGAAVRNTSQSHAEPLPAGQTVYPTRAQHLCKCVAASGKECPINKYRYVLGGRK